MFITALDIGTSQIRAIVVKPEKNGKLRVHGIFKSVSNGIRKGELIDMESAANSLKNIFNEIKTFDKAALKNIFVNAGGTNVKCHNSRGIIAVSRADNEISQDDIDRVIKASQAIKLLPNRMILHTIKKEFIIDGMTDVREPLGMAGTRLEVNSIIIDAFSQNIKNFIYLIESLGGDVGGLIYNPLAASSAVLTKNQKDLGVVLIDFGAGTTSMAVYEEGKLLHTASFPVGAANITNDIAIGLKCSVELAELLKIYFGSAFPKDISIKEKISPDLFKETTGFELSEIDRNFKDTISRRFISEIIESRLEEIFEFINNELKSINKAGHLPGGAMICGGVAKMPGLIDLAKKELKLAAGIGLPNLKDLEVADSGVDGWIDDSESALVVGLAYEGADRLLKENKWQIKDKLSFKKILNYFMP